MKKFLILIIIAATFLSAQSLEGKDVICGRYKSLMKMTTAGRVMTINQEKVDAVFYRIVLDINPVTQTISGQVMGNFRIIDSTVTHLELDFINGMNVTDVTLDGASQTFTHTNDILQIPISSNPASGEIISVEIEYNGNPGSTGFGSFSFGAHAGQTLIWTLSEPYGARTWWPCKDDPSDKADSVDIIVTVPTGLTVASNGNLFDTAELGEKTTFYWQERYPITTYLVSLAIYPYQVFHDQYVSAANDTMPLDFYVFPDHYSSVYANYMETSDMITFFASIFGEYPFITEKYGHAEFGWGGGMEHQTLTSLGGWSESLIAHELAHQWYGDMITCASFHHIWLNEGFATYAEALWYEDKDGIEAYHYDMSRNMYFGDGTIYVEDPQTTSDIFNYSLTYMKSSWVLHMLRNVVGDTVFFEILQTYSEAPDMKYNSITTAQFQELCETVSGVDLNYFFNQWIYGTYYPNYSLFWEQTGNMLSVEITQTPLADNAFRMPIDLEIICADTTFRTRVINSLLSEDYSIVLPEDQTVIAVILDPDNWILKYVTYDNNGVDHSLPVYFLLGDPYPNPFNTSVTIPFTSRMRGEIGFSIFNILGEEVWRHNDFYETGEYAQHWGGRDLNGSTVSSGVYFLKMKYPAGQSTEKLLLIK